MPSWAVKNFGGEIPRQDPRLLPDGMSEWSVNCDLASGPLDGLPQPEFQIDLTNKRPYPVRKAYRFPGPAAGQADFWLPLPSEWSSVVRSPLANDTLHRIYWTNPPGQPAAGAWWNTYERLVAGSPDYNLGFVAPDPASTLTVKVSGGTLPSPATYSANGITVATPGAGYGPGGLLTVLGGTLASGQTQLTQAKIVQTQALNFAIVAAGTAGTGGPDGPVQFFGTTGVGSRFILDGTLTNGVLSSIDGVVSHGGYTTNPTNPSFEPVIGPGMPTGVIIFMQMGVFGLEGGFNAIYSTPPTNPAATTISGPGSGCTLNVSYTQQGFSAGIPFVTRSYCYTFVDQYGLESSPCVPSATLDGPPDASWTVTGFPTAPPASPAGKSYPVPVKMRLYRTLASASAGANFYFVTDLTFGQASYVDTIPDTTVVNNNLLESTSWASPPDGLDGLTAMPGGMLIGFTGNTVHFCEVNRPHAWPAGFDQSLLYQIQGMAVWQQSLVVVTQGFPSTGAGTNPSSFIFQMLQAPEPCIARGSIVTDLAGVYYASLNGLISLNYFGMQNQTLSNFTREQWLTDFHAANIIACRHRAQYLAVNGTGMGFLIDYTEQRMGVVHIAPVVGIISVWNDVFTGEAFMMANDNKVYKWDSTITPSLNYCWRSKQFYLPAPTNLGACQVSLDASVTQPAPPAVVPQPGSHDPTIVLPPGINALFRLYLGGDQQIKVHERYLTSARMIFRLPSGFKVFNWQFEIVARVPVHSVELATTMKELRGV